MSTIITLDQQLCDTVKKNMDSLIEEYESKNYIVQHDHTDSKGNRSVKMKQLTK